MFTRCRFQNISVRVPFQDLPFSKSAGKDVLYSCERETYPPHFSQFSRCAGIVRTKSKSPVTLGQLHLLTELLSYRNANVFWFISFSLMTNKGIGYSAHFSGPMLVLEVHGKGNKVFTILVKFEFRPQIVSTSCYVIFLSSKLSEENIRMSRPAVVQAANCMICM